MKVTVVGGGKIGYYLAKTLIEHHHDPTVIEQDKKTSRFIANDLDIPIICGDGTTMEVLEAAAVAQSDAVICVTGMDENNLIACQLAKMIYNVPKTIAKVNNPKNAGVMKQLGVDIVISGTDNIANLLEREVDTSAIKQMLSLNEGNASIIEVSLQPDSDLDGTKIKDVKLPLSCNIVSITRSSKLIIPRGNSVLHGGDKLLIMAENTVIHEVKKSLKISQSGA